MCVCVCVCVMLREKGADEEAVGRQVKHLTSKPSHTMTKPTSAAGRCEASQRTNQTYLCALTKPICVISDLEGALRDKKESDEMLARAGIFSCEYSITIA